MLGIYTRLSKEDEESNSISNQSREGFSFATKNNFDYKVYDEGEGISGTLDIENRPVLTNLITDVNNGTVKQIWMRNQNRLDRNSLTFFIFIDAVKKNNVDVYFGDNDKL
ncbi:MAG: recombinase family protein, partial [Flavobacteriaceae bacterium]|nr:recombinase family protein [Flavobacteriaceae bacterium]